jgi:putative NIF3 family GTP cyclohydrolase 1 type 2
MSLSHSVSRILFALALTSLAFGQTTKEGAGVLTAQDVVDRIRSRVSEPVPPATVDTFKAGDPNTPVRRIAVVMMATHAVLERAAAAGANFIITHEPTYYDHRDASAELEAGNDSVFAAKQALIRKHGLVIWRFHDYLHRLSPDPVVVGLARVFGWENVQTTPGVAKFTIPEITLEALADQIRQKLAIRALRVVGDPRLKITRVGMTLGFTGFERNRRMLHDDEVEALILGEANEWEIIEYAADAVAQKRRKALIVLGHIPSEEAGMRESVRWLKTFVPEVPVDFIVTPEPFWIPGPSK